MADYDWFDNEPTKAEIEASKWRPQGFHPVFHRNSIGKADRVSYYLCRRGCGTVVWSPKIHMQNVCTKYEPVAGD